MQPEPPQQEFLRSAMSLLKLTRDSFARRFGVARRALDTYLLPSTSKQFRPLPEVLGRYVNEVVWLYAAQRLTYTRCVHMMDFSKLDVEAMLRAQIDPVLVSFAGVRSKEATSVMIVVDGVPRPLPFHLAVRSHSPIGFEWGYSGSGPLQLALAICVELVGPVQAERVYHGVQDRLLVGLTREKWTLMGIAAMEAIEKTAAEGGFTRDSFTDPVFRYGVYQGLSWPVDRKSRTR